MTRLRTLIRGHFWAALALLVAALAVRIAVPAGMMPAYGPDGPTLILCSGHMEPAMAGMAPAAMAGMPAKGDGKHDATPSDAPCAFTGLLAVALDGAALPVLPPPLVVAIAVLLATLVGAIVPACRLWPPRRGPPAAFA